MRNNNKELKFEFGKHLAHIRTTKNEKGTALRLGLVVRLRSATDAQQPDVRNPGH